MQITETANEGLKRGYKVVVSAADIESQLVERLDEVSKTVNLPGFRRGKVPAKVVRQRFGKSLMGEILEKTVDESSRNLMAEKDLRPAMQPKIEVLNFDEGQDLEYSVEVEILPAIEPMDFSTLKLEKPVVDVTDDMLDEQLTRLADNQKVFNTVERAAADGDAAIIDFVGSVDGVEFEGGKGTDYQLVLGSGTFIPGFEDQLIGAKAGDEKDVNVTFPENYGAADLAGKEALFKCTVKEIKEGAAPELNDEFASNLGLENLDGLKDAVKDQMKREHDNLSRDAIKRRLLDQLAEAHSFDVPPGLVEVEFNAIWEQLGQEMAQNGDTFESLEQTEDEAKEEYRGIAERRVRLGLLLSEVGRLNNVQISEDEVNRAIMDQVRRYPGQEQQVFEMFRNNPQARESLRAPILEEKVVDYILELAEVTENPMTLDELLNLDPDAEPAAEEKPKKKAPAKKKTTAKKADEAVEGEEKPKATRKRATKKADAAEADAEGEAKPKTTRKRAAKKAEESKDS